MRDKGIHIKFDKKTAVKVKEPLLNSYGFDLTDENAIGFSVGKLKFTVMGFKVATQLNTLLATVKVNPIPFSNEQCVYVHPINLYDAERIMAYARSAATQLKANVEDVKAGLYSLRERLERYRLDELKSGFAETKKVTLSTEIKKQAQEILKCDNVMDSIEGLLQQAGLVTEMENGLRLFLILLSRNFGTPLHALLQGSPQLCRMLMDTVTNTLPEDQIHEITSMSGSNLYYPKSKDHWKNKVLYITSIDKYFKGASTIKEFLENRILRRYTTEADPLSRKVYSTAKIVKGPICLLGYSEDETVNSKFFQECFFIRVEENEQNKVELLEHFMRDFSGQTDKATQEQARTILKAIQLELWPLKVVVPFADKLQLPSTVFHPLRTFNQLITFVRSVALLHQHTLKKKKDPSGEEYIEANHEHLEIALALFKDIAIQKSDILPPGQRSFLERLKMEVKDPKCSFKIPEVLKALRMKKSFFYKEFQDLKEQGFIAVAGGNKKHGLDYRITDWEDYKGIQEGMSVLTEQVKVLQTEVSTRIPPSFHEVSTDKKSSKHKGSRLNKPKFT